MRALDGAQYIDAAGEVEPAVAGFFDQAPAVQSLQAFQWWQVAAQAAPVDLEAEQFQPVLEAVQRQIAAVPREFATAVEAAFQSPQRQRIEADDHDLPFRDQDALDFAQDLVRFVAEFENMRHDDQIDAVGGDRQGRVVAQEIGAIEGAGTLTQGNAAGAQEVGLGQADLQCVVAENVADDVIDLSLLPGQDMATWCGGEPVVESGN